VFSFDPTINLGTILQAFLLFSALLGVGWRMSTRFNTLESNIKHTANEVFFIKAEIGKITDILVTLGKQEIRLDGLDRRIDEIRSGYHVK